MAAGGVRFTVRAPGLAKLEKRLTKVKDRENILAMRKQMKKVANRQIVPFLRRAVPRSRAAKKHLRDTAAAKFGGGLNFRMRIGVGSKDLWYGWIVNARVSPFLQQTLDQAVPPFFAEVDKLARRNLRNLTRR